jgi:hypothetical protein
VDVRRLSITSSKFERSSEIMSVQLRWLSLGLALMAMVGFGTVAGSSVFAQDATPTPSVSTDDRTNKPDDANDRMKGDREGKSGRGGMGGGHMHGKFGVDIDELATFLGVTADEITTSIRSGSSLAEIAEANGVTRDELKAFLVQQYEAGLDAVIDASRDVKSDDLDGVGGTDDATPAVDATPAASTGLVA